MLHIVLPIIFLAIVLITLGILAIVYGDR